MSVVKVRNLRLRKMLHQVNKYRKLQASQIDLLCNDIISSQREFIKRLDRVSFRSDFYETLIGINDINALLCFAAEAIQNELADTNVIFYFRQGENRVHKFMTHEQISEQSKNLIQSLTPNVIENICRSNQICSIETLLEMGIMISPSAMKSVSVSCVPLENKMYNIGFVLLMRCSGQQFTNSELNYIHSISPGLTSAFYGYMKKQETVKS